MLNVLSGLGYMGSDYFEATVGLNSFKLNSVQN